ncbi:RNA-binding protein 48 [Solenopsis invicta]|uniref:RNA-binding protein 48 n=1 Tax=Solenopsis invicta TaxID=13686 RepID=UPI000595A154|nr:RNA-binding protein 48 [Solenopsis invicta]XP_039313659.1 RNA-binding protein 48 [Solenopsis invicta]
MTEKCTLTHMPHHMQQKLCHTRPLYRQGKKLTAVKVYTINDESQHLLLCGVPQLQLGEEIKKLIYPYGSVKAIQLVTEYPSEEFTETYHIHYAHIQSARIAKRSIDNKNFFGGILHVCYVPELETIEETKAKLIQRRKDVATQIKRIQQESANPKVDKFIPREQYHRRKKTPALPLTEERIKHCYPGETLSSICNGIPQSIDPRPVSEPRLPINWKDDYNSGIASSSESYPAPYQSTEAIIQTGIQQANKNLDSNVCKRKNYKGHCTNNKIKIIRPRLIDTRNIARLNSTEKTNVFCNIKKVESGITIKLLEKSHNEKKKIVIKNPSVISLVQSSKDLQSSIQTAKAQIRTIMQKHNT